LTPEAPLRQTENGLEPAADGWFVLNATDAPWVGRVGLGRACLFESLDEACEFGEFGINIHVLDPGEPNGMYHAEDAQEGFLVLSGECLLIVEGEERRLRQWDYAHFPPGTKHIVVGAGDGPAAVLMVGTRKDPEEIVYPVEPAAQRHGAGVDEETPDPKVAYERFTQRSRGPYRSGDLPAA
jgi:uncharacterized cupin superfamily protein